MNTLNTIQKSLRPLRFLYLGLVSLSLFFFTSCGQDSANRNIDIPGLVGPEVTIHEDVIQISVIFEDLVLDVGGRFPIPEFPHSAIELSPDLQSSGTLLTAFINLQDLFDDRVKYLDPKTLPGGRPLPGVINGKLPAVAFTIPSFNNTAVYVGKEVFGTYIPFNIDMYGTIATYRFYVQGERAGNISLVGQDEAGENGGLLLMLDISSKVKKELLKIKNQYSYKYR